MDGVGSSVLLDDAKNTELDALQQLGFSLVEGEVDLALPVNNVSDSGAEVVIHSIFLLSSNIC